MSMRRTFLKADLNLKQQILCWRRLSFGKTGAGDEVIQRHLKEGMIKSFCKTYQCLTQTWCTFMFTAKAQSFLIRCAAVMFWAQNLLKLSWKKNCKYFTALLYEKNLFIMDIYLMKHNKVDCTIGTCLFKRCVAGKAEAFEWGNSLT